MVNKQEVSIAPVMSDGQPPLTIPHQNTLLKPPKIGNYKLLLTSSGQEWQFQIAAEVSSMSRIAILNCYWHPVVQEWQFHIATDI